ncbi:MAG: hypothetical protein ACK5KN_01495 [Dysgonomonas sp.]|uniref:hypothetical protein n=1 Tax=Dysgonomonas sp. TaxID=1891233 RepID=UPI003A852FBC
MKKNYLYLLAMVMVAMFSFASCSSDDDEDNNDGSDGSNNAQLEVGASNLFFNNQKINTTSDENYSRINEISYERNGKIYILYIKIEYGDDGDYANFRFDDVHLDDLKVGDDIVKLAEWYNYQVDNYKGHMYAYYSYFANAEGIFGGHQGEFIVKEIEKVDDETILRIDFNNAKLFFSGTSSQSTVDVRGAIKAKVRR